MKAEYQEAPQSVLTIAGEVIEQHHPYLKECRIGFVMRFGEPAKSGGKMVVAKTSTITEKIRPLLNEDIDILVEISEDFWTRFSTAQRTALIDHELCHIQLNTAGTWSASRAHDVEEFSEIVERYGFWTSDLLGSKTSFEKAMQMELPIEHKPQLVKVDVKSFGGLSDALNDGEETPS